MSVKGAAAIVVIGVLATLLASASLGGSTRETLDLTTLAVGAAVGAGLLGALLLHAVRDRSIAVQSVLVALTPIGAVAAAAMAASHLMMVSSHPIAALGVVLAASGTVGILISLLLGARLRLGSERLINATRQIGRGNLQTRIERPPSGELAEVAQELEVMQAQLEQSRARERDLEAARRELVTWMSHDLRTPLARLRAIVEALEDGVISNQAEVSSCYERLRSETDRMTTLVNDLFELNRINAKELVLEPERTRLADIVSDVAASFSVTALARGIELRTPAPIADPDVEVSPRHLERALGNLLDNAFRHTQSGGTVDVSIATGRGCATVNVDDGCGATEVKTLERLLYNSTTLHPPTTGNGSGFGLAIAKGLIEAQGGNLAVAGTEHGCRFTITVPLAPAKTAHVANRVGLTAATDRPGREPPSAAD